MEFTLLFNTLAAIQRPLNNQLLVESIGAYGFQTTFFSYFVRKIFSILLATFFFYFVINTKIKDIFKIQILYLGSFRKILLQGGFLLFTLRQIKVLNQTFFELYDLPSTPDFTQVSSLITLVILGISFFGHFLPITLPPLFFSYLQTFLLFLGVFRLRTGFYLSATSIHQIPDFSFSLANLNPEKIGHFFFMILPYELIMAKSRRLSTTQVSSLIFSSVVGIFFYDLFLMFSLHNSSTRHKLILYEDMFPMRNSTLRHVFFLGGIINRSLAWQIFKHETLEDIDQSFVELADKEDKPKFEVGKFVYLYLPLCLVFLPTSTCLTLMFVATIFIYFLLTQNGRPLSILYSRPDPTSLQVMSLIASSALFGVAGIYYSLTTELWSTLFRCMICILYPAFFLNPILYPYLILLRAPIVAPRILSFLPGPLSIKIRWNMLINPFLLNFCQKKFFENNKEQIYYEIIE
jgi:hypothetical protein